MLNEMFAASLLTAAFGLRLFTALVFLLAGLQKLQSRLEFQGVLANYKIAPAKATSSLSWAVPALELLCSVALIASPATGTAVAALLLTAYGLAMGLNLKRGRTHIDCGCGGEATPLSPALIGRNLIIALGLALCVALELSAPSHPLVPANFLVATAFAAGLYALYVSFNQLQTNAGIYRRLWLGERVG